jgi:hypothetical protein
MLSFLDADLLPAGLRRFARIICIIDDQVYHPNGSAVTICFHIHVCG